MAMLVITRGYHPCNSIHGVNLNQGSHHGEPQLPLTDLCKEVEEVARHEEEGAELSWASELSFFFLWTHGELFGVNCWDANSEYMAYECLWQFLWNFYHSKNGDIYMRHRDTQTNGGFLKWGHPQIIHLNRNFQYKPSFFGYPHLWKPPSLGIFQNQSNQSPLMLPSKHLRIVFF